MKRLRRKLKKVVLTLAVKPIQREMFSQFGARLWLRERSRDITKAPFSKERRQAHKAGFSLDVYQANRLEGRNPLISQRAYLSLQPLQRPQNWLKNRMVAERFLPGLVEHNTGGICTVFGARGNLSIVRRAGFPEDLSRDENGLLELIKRFEQVQVQPIRWDRGLGRIVTWNSAAEQFAIDGWPANYEDVVKTITSMTARERCVFFEFKDIEAELGERFGLESARVRLHLAKRETGEVVATEAAVIAGDTWRPAFPTEEEIKYARAEQGVRRGWSRRRSKLSFREERHEILLPLDIASGHIDWERSHGQVTMRPEALPEIRDIAEQLQAIFEYEKARFGFISVDVVIDHEGKFTLRDISSFPRYPRYGKFSLLSEEYLTELLALRKKEGTTRRARESLVGRAQARARRLRRRISVFQLRAQGFSGRMAKSWVRRVDRDRRRNSGFDLDFKKQSYRWGFLPQQVTRFGITEENRSDFISERDYRFVQPLNGKYGKWVRDRVSALAVFEPFAELFEPTHYQIVRRGTELQIIPLSPEARAYGNAIENIGEFLAERSHLILASSAWSGSVALRVSYEDNSFWVDGSPYSEDEFERLLSYRVRDQFYVLLEPVNLDSNSDELEEASAVGPQTELQISMMNPSGSKPELAEAFMVVADEVSKQDFERLLGDDGTADAGQEAELARTEHKEDVGAERQKNELDDARVENESDEHDEVLYQKFFSRIDPNTGHYSGAKTVHEGSVQTIAAHPVSGEVFEGLVPNWDLLIRRLQEMCNFAPQLSFVEFRVTISAGTPTIRGIAATPTYSTIFPFSEATSDFIQTAVREKSEKSAAVSVRATTWANNAKRTIRKRFALLLYPEGLVPYQSVRWIGDVRRDLFQRNGVSLPTKIWAYRNGFLSYRIPQYGITPENREQFISDFEYRWLRHINKKYKYWLEDKISIKYVASKHNESLPEYYYYTSLHGGINHVIPMMDCPEGYGATFTDILRLARDKGLLALKPDEGSHGEGFFRLAYKDGEYTLNGEPASESRVLAILQDAANQYIVTEFIVMHPVIAEIYPNSVNTIRVIVFKKDGITPEIGNAYMRIGSLKSGYVDNTAAGGMLAKIDVESGRFGDGQSLENGRVVPCPVHPDTGVLIEGIVPNWELAKRKVLEIATDLPQLEYLGFDLAITAEGIKLPEINRSPDYPRIDLLTSETTDYLFHKLQSKKKLYGYDVKHPRKLISLPRRES